MFQLTFTLFMPTLLHGIFNMQTAPAPGLPCSPQATFVAHSVFRELRLQLMRSVKRINQKVDKLTKTVICVDSLIHCTQCSSEWHLDQQSLGNLQFKAFCNGVLILPATIPDQLLLLSCGKRIAAIESHRLMYINREISFDIFQSLLECTIFSQPSIYIDGWLYGMRMTSVVCNVPVLSQNDSTYHHSVFTT